MEETLKKMGLILEKVALKVDELDKRLKSLEAKVAQLEGNNPPPIPKEKGEETSAQTQTTQSHTTQTTQPGTTTGGVSSSQPHLSSAQFGANSPQGGVPGMGATPQQQAHSSGPSPLAMGGSSFLGSLLGSFAGMGLFKTLFDNNVSASDVAKESQSGESGDEDISAKLDEINSKLDQLSQEIEEEKELDPETDLEGILDDIEDFGDDLVDNDGGDWGGSDDWGGDFDF
ncbi:MAG: hypothetical protein C6I01_03775 [Epsilonproteobacteria bacterium]|jgi:outer membrane murein-binding lipoprotein Lpp|nr:hypothetical protein [Campylobacterota bacterium]NPA89712.1 hypothetical protein [Campylobacterota bacterium]